MSSEPEEYEQTTSPETEKEAELDENQEENPELE